MAGRGPAPKPGSRTRHRPQRGEWVDLAPLEEPLLEPLPAGDWSAESVELWEAWRRDPVSAQWSPADRAFALVTIRLFDVKPVGSASEVRLRMDSLGLTPKGKRDLRWRVGAQVEVPAVESAASVRRLRAVG